MKKSCVCGVELQRSDSYDIVIYVLNSCQDKDRLTSKNNIELHQLPNRCYGLVWFGLVWFGLVWFGLVCFVLFCFGLVWFGLVCLG